MDAAVDAGACTARKSDGVCPKRCPTPWKPLCLPLPSPFEPRAASEIVAQPPGRVTTASFPFYDRTLLSTVVGGKRRPPVRG